jgi:3-dehydroquinate dehydratase-1
MNTNLCVSLPIKHNTLEALKDTLKRISKENPKLIEFRLDYLSDLNLLNYKFLKNILTFVPENIETILTLRSFQEGGFLQIQENVRIDLLKLIIKAQPTYVDLELTIEKNKLKRLLNMAIEKKVGTILSYHNFKETPSYKDALGLVNDYYKMLTNNNEIDKQILKNSIFKFIFKANKFQDNLVPLKLCKEFQKPVPILSFCMGNLGTFSRLLCIKISSPFTYVSLDEKTAQGQIDIKTAKTIYELLF